MVLPEQPIEQPMRFLLWDFIAKFERRITALETKIAEPHDRLETLEQRVRALEHPDTARETIGINGRLQRIFQKRTLLILQAVWLNGKWLAKR